MLVGILLDLLPIAAGVLVRPSLLVAILVTGRM
ncbi:hypothetical protein Btus_1139 [Kyrpidia tusciae DSM 2912]|uniref:Uncharacterized protein n=1 Tax=Kyrpidia tusciae (strain DSM 2912 / NBRC 15312 / T2) TaxID=562970 RepID=D5WXF4_KYRT2|nr:hypothetical protein Btus_1139 [Kyrpidia tusciae DSM 2912]